VLRNISVSWQKMQGAVRVIKVTGAPSVSYWELKTPNGNSLGFSSANTLGILTFDTSFSGSANLFPVTLRGTGYRGGIPVSAATLVIAAGYSVTPPTMLAGAINVASGSFTITSSSIAALTSVTLSSNLAGAFSPSVINLPLGSSSQTFTYTPTVVGNHVISFGSPLTNPSPINFTALAQPAGSYTVTPPSAFSGSIGVASNSFTINSSGLTAPVAITLSSSLAGTFSQAVINLPIGSSTQSFTYTPTVVGSHVIFFNSSLTDPSPVNYTAISPPSGGTIILDTQFVTLAGTLSIPVGGSSNYIIRHVTATANGTISFTGTPTQDMRVEIWNRSAPGIIVTVQTPPDGLALAPLNTGLGESKLTLDYDLTSNTWYGVVTNG
jgi:hypothetical protein